MFQYQKTNRYFAQISDSMEELGKEELIKAGVPEGLIRLSIGLEDVDKAYQLMDEGRCGKVAVVFDEELK